jgi:uncharacterized protein (TIGR00730 family)
LIQSICVYCGSSDRVKPVYVDAAYQIGREIAGRGWVLWYGAGSTGLMGAVADGALASRGTVIGVIPEIFNTPQLAHSGLHRLEVVENMHLRKQRLVDQVDAFIALPGGYGTFEELFEILTWAQIGLHQKPVGLLNTAGYFDPLLHMVERALLDGFLYDEHPALLLRAGEPAALLDALDSYQPPAGLDRWVNREPGD